MRMKIWKRSKFKACHTLTWVLIIMLTGKYVKKFYYLQMKSVLTFTTYCMYIQTYNTRYLVFLIVFWHASTSCFPSVGFEHFDKKLVGWLFPSLFASSLGLFNSSMYLCIYIVHACTYIFYLSIKKKEKQAWL